MSSAQEKALLDDVGKPATWSSSFMFSSVSLRDMSAAANQAGSVAGGQGASTRIKARLYQDLSTWPRLKFLPFRVKPAATYLPSLRVRLTRAHLIRERAPIAGPSFPRHHGK